MRFFLLLSSNFLQISSVTSMSFLTDRNLTFHRFGDGTISSAEEKSPQPNPNESVWTTSTVLDYSAVNPTLAVDESATSKTKILSSPNDDTINKRYSCYSSTFDSSSAAVSRNATHNGSTLKLIQVHKEDLTDDTSKQVRARRNFALFSTQFPSSDLASRKFDATTRHKVCQMARLSTVHTKNN